MLREVQLSEFRVEQSLCSLVSGELVRQQLNWALTRLPCFQAHSKKKRDNAIREQDGVKLRVLLGNCTRSLASRLCLVPQCRQQLRAWVCQSVRSATVISWSAQQAGDEDDTIDSR